MSNNVLVIAYTSPDFDRLFWHPNPSDEERQRILDIHDTYAGVTIDHERLATHDYVTGYTKEGESDPSFKRNGWREASDLEPLVLAGTVTIVVAGSVY